MDAGQETGQVVLINITVPSFTPAPLQIFLSERNGSAEIKTMEINKQLDHMAILGDHRYVVYAHLFAVLYVTCVCVKSMLHVQYMIPMLVCMCVRACVVCTHVRVHVLCTCVCVHGWSTFNHHLVFREARWQPLPLLLEGRRYLGYSDHVLGSIEVLPVIPNQV